MSLEKENAILAVCLGEAPRPVGRLACRDAHWARGEALGTAGLGAARMVFALRRCGARRREGSKSESIFGAF